MAFLMTFQLTIPALAAANTTSGLLSDEMYEKLRIVYNDAEGFSVDREALENACVGTPISAYELVDGAIEELPFVFYPVISGEEILLFIIDNEGALTVFVDAEGSFTAGLSAFINTPERIALLYDSTSCYAVTNKTAEKVISFGQEVSYRGAFSDTAQIMARTAEEDLTLSAVAPKSRVQSHRLTAADSPAAYSVNSEMTDVALIIPFVSQLIDGNPSSICWAAAIACIGNYLTDYSYTAVEIAQAYWCSEYDYNYGLDLPNIGSVLYNNYGIYYQYYGGSAPSDTLLITNLSNGYPVYSRWWYPIANGKIGLHATVIRGIHESAGSMFLMDPEYGFYVADRTSSSYSYTNANGLTLTLNGYCSMFS